MPHGGEETRHDILMFDQNMARNRPCDFGQKARKSLQPTESDSLDVRSKIYRRRQHLESQICVIHTESILNGHTGFKFS